MSIIEFTPFTVLDHTCYSIYNLNTILNTYDYVDYMYTFVLYLIKIVKHDKW